MDSYFTQHEEGVIRKLSKCLEMKNMHRINAWKSFARTLRSKNESIDRIEDTHKEKTKRVIYEYFMVNGKEWSVVANALHDIRVYDAVYIVVELLKVHERNVLLDLMLHKRLSYIYDKQSDGADRRKICHRLMESIRVDGGEKARMLDCKPSTVTKNTQFVLTYCFSEYSEQHNRRVYDWIGLKNKLDTIGVRKGIPMIKQRIRELVKDAQIPYESVPVNLLNHQILFKIQESALRDGDIDGLAVFFDEQLHISTNNNNLAEATNECLVSFLDRNEVVTVADLCSALHFIGNANAYNCLVDNELHTCYPSYADRERSCGSFVTLSELEYSHFKDRVANPATLQEAFEALKAYLWTATTPHFRSTLAAESINRSRMRWDLHYFFQSLDELQHLSPMHVSQYLADRIAKKKQPNSLLQSYLHFANLHRQQLSYKEDKFFLHVERECGVEWCGVVRRWCGGVCVVEGGVREWVEWFVERERRRWGVYEEGEERVCVAQDYDTWNYIYWLLEKAGAGKCCIKAAGAVVECLRQILRDLGHEGSCPPPEQYWAFAER